MISPGDDSASRRESRPDQIFGKDQSLETGFFSEPAHLQGVPTMEASMIAVHKLQRFILAVTRLGIGRGKVASIFLDVPLDEALTLLADKYQLRVRTNGVGVVFEAHDDAQRELGVVEIARTASPGEHMAVSPPYLPIAQADRKTFQLAQPEETHPRESQFRRRPQSQQGPRPRQLSPLPRPTGSLRRPSNQR
jgi:hypothetical protein